jgi:LCP family protein required for cell wall assembly
MVFSRASSLSEKIFAGQTTTFFGKVWEAIRGVSGRITLEGENKGQINVLLLGIGGPGHEGPYLSDTMILAQIRPKTSEVAFISIPRDLLAELPNNLGSRKINAVFAEGIAQSKDQNEAGRWSRMAVERLSGQTIPYFAVIDFAGFKKAVDEVGGLEINVDNTFTDSEFPDEKLGYLPPLTFKAGLEHMDGQRALQFARSRHGSNGEASDFARSVRQQKVIKAFKEKILNLNLITGIGRINNLLDIFADNFYTNLTPGEIFRLYDIVKEQNIQTFLTLSLDPDTGLLCATSHETAGYILVPCEGKTVRDIENFFKNAFALGKLREEKSIIWLANSTAEASAYTESENKLKAGNLTVWQLNYDQDALAQTIVYQVNPKPATLEYVKNVLGAKEVSLPPPGVKVDSAKVDMIVILGKNN